MTKLSHDSAAAAAALSSMSDAAEGLKYNTREYTSSLEQNVFANLSGDAVKKFIGQSQAHCDNLSKISKDLSEITNALSDINKYSTDKDTTIGRGA